MLLGGRAIKGGRVRADVGLPKRCPGTKQRKTGEVSGKNPYAETRAPDFLTVYVSRSLPPTLEVTGDLDKEDRRVERSGYDLGAGTTGCDGGINERLREGWPSFPLLSSAIPKSRGS
jgi:hypothetical protein